MKRNATLVFIAMALFVLLYNAFLPAHPDETYYWQWGRHLALSYYDGPPLMAYLIHIITGILGSTAFTLKLTAVLLMLGTSFIVYRFTLHLWNERAAYIALLLTLTMPFVQAGFVVSTLDPALIFFWTLTLYLFYLAISKSSNLYRYLTGVALGLTLLAKYSGVMLPVGLFAFLILSSEYRKELKNPHWYLSALLALVVFSPVLIWNWQHDWASFTFQYNHGVAAQKIFQLNLAGQFLGAQFGAANPILFIAAFYYTFRYAKTVWRDSKLLLLALPFLVTFGFFFYQACFQTSEANWPAPAYISAVILVSYFLDKFNRNGLFYSIVALGLVLMVFMRFPSTTPFLPNNAILKTKFMGYNVLAQEAAVYIKPGEIILSNTIQNTSELAFYLPGQPETYDLIDTHQMYYYWSTPIKQAIKDGKITQAIYIGDAEDVPTLHQYFKHVDYVATVKYSDPWLDREWVVYRAWN